MSTPQNSKKAIAIQDPSKAARFKREACLVVYVRFYDGNVRTYYNRDIDYKEDPDPRKRRLYHLLHHWVYRWRQLIQKEEPEGWKGQVWHAAIFQMWDGNRGDKICQFMKERGGWID
jgi:hypothetical protein